MMKLKLAFLSILTLSICSVVNAEEYKAPSVKFKKNTFKQTQVVDAEVDDYYKYESQIKGYDRQIASEDPVKEEKRMPSSFKAHLEKEEGPSVEPVKHEDKPQMWFKDNHRIDRRSGKDFNQH